MTCKPICYGLSRRESNALYREVMMDDDREAMRRLCREDVFFLLTVGCNRTDIDRDWLYDRCREVEAEPDGMLDLWAREHYKSTIITYGMGICDILASHGDDPHERWGGREVTIGILSHTRPIAKSFLGQIKSEFETNEFLKDLFPDVLYENPQRESPSWSLDKGICVKRKSNPKEMTVEASGLVDGQPVSKHYVILNYDDVVTRESVTNEDMIKKVTDAWELSLSLTTEGGKIRYIGTRYHFNDTYKTMLDREAATPRIYPATHDGTLTGRPVFMKAETLKEKLKAQGPYTYGCQMLQNPKADNAMGFDETWLRHVTPISPDELKSKRERGWFIVAIVDPANAKKKDSDYTSGWVVALTPEENYYILDGTRDRLNLVERTKWVFDMYDKWKPDKILYEEYSIQADIQHIEFVQGIERKHFDLTPVGGSMAKNDRIRRLVAPFFQGRVFMPDRLMFVDQNETLRDLISEFVKDEFLPFPVAAHDDMLDALARLEETTKEGVRVCPFPEVKEPKPPRTLEGLVPKPEAYDPFASV